GPIWTRAIGIYEAVQQSLLSGAGQLENGARADEAAAIRCAVEISGSVSHQTRSGTCSITGICTEIVQDGFLAGDTDLEHSSSEVSSALVRRAVQVPVRIEHQVTIWLFAVTYCTEIVQDGFLAGGTQLEDHSLIVSSTRDGCAVEISRR